VTSKEIKRVSLDIKSDLEYPNKLRSAENPGYKTTYTGKERVVRPRGFSVVSQLAKLGHYLNRFSVDFSLFEVHNSPRNLSRVALPKPGLLGRTTPIATDHEIIQAEIVVFFSRRHPP
jgi:hypothetical protein